MLPLLLICCVSQIYQALESLQYMRTYFGEKLEVQTCCRSSQTNIPSVADASVGPELTEEDLSIASARRELEVAREVG